MLAFQKTLDRQRITQSDIDEVKAEMAADRLKPVVPVWRDLREDYVVNTSPTKKPVMTIRVNRDARPVLKKVKDIT